MTLLFISSLFIISLILSICLLVLLLLIIHFIIFNKEIIKLIENIIIIINKKEVKGSFIAYFPTYLKSYEHTDYFVLINAYSGSIDYGFNEIRNYYLINGDKKYNNKDMN